MTVTARHVAERLGVAVSTVGRALADDPRISAETRTRVRLAAEQLGYVGNTPARVMRGASSKLIGLVLPDVRNSFYATIAQALSQCCDVEGYHVALSITSDDRDVEARHVRELASARVAGFVITPTAAPRRETIAILNDQPHVQLLRRLPELGESWFGVDDEECLRIGARHLIELGHRRIAYIGGATALPTGKSRLNGFRRAFAEAGIEASDAIEELGPTDIEFGSAAARRILAASPSVTAVITGSVQITVGLLNVVREQRVLAPDALSIVGFGDPPSFQWWGTEGLTTLRMPVYELATSCSLWFLHQLKSRQTPGRFSSITSASLVVRGSTGPMKG